MAGPRMPLSTLRVRPRYRPVPFQGIILEHPNEAEWQTFKNNNNEAFLDRIWVY